MANMLDQLAIPVGERDFAALMPDRRIKPGVTLPPPKAVFPRYVEPEAAS
jgi:methionyl-tRNA synthetase